MIDLLGNSIEVKRAAAKKRASEIRLSEPLEGAQFRFLSLGVGLQSAALALMSARGDLPRLDAAIFADTGGEKRRTYAYLDWLETVCPFPIIRTKRRGASLQEFLLDSTKLELAGRMTAPFYTSDEDGTPGMLMKQCSKEFKTRVVHRYIRDRLDLKPKERGPKTATVELWLGMTTDELHRVGTSEKRYIHQRYPLIEARYRRNDLPEWFAQRQLPRPPKSSCKFCPFQLKAQWRDMRENDPEDFADAISFDDAIRKPYLGFTGSAYLLRDRVPLSEANLESAAESGQSEFDIDGAIECGDGYCGV